MLAIEQHKRFRSDARRDVVQPLAPYGKNRNRNAGSVKSML